MEKNNLAIKISNLEFRYGTGPIILKISDLSIKQGQKVFLFGPSGSGKTTLLGILAGVLTVPKGMVSILGQDFGSLSSYSRDRFRGSHLGYVFQMFNLIPYLTVMQNICLPCELSLEREARLSGMNVTEAALKIGNELGISELMNRKITELSVGQQQRVAVARSLLGKPEIVIADEPTSALDYDHREKFLKLLFDEAKKSESTVVFVSHDRQLQPLFETSISLKEINQI